MALSMHQASVPVFVQMLGSLSGVLGKANDFAVARKIDPATLLQSRLFPDMLPLVRQVQIAADFAKGASARLAGVDLPRYADDEKSFEDLQARIAKTIAFITSLPAAAIDASADRMINFSVGPREMSLTGRIYLLHFATPNFYFHATTAYAILRESGVELGKRDFIGALPD